MDGSQVRGYDGNHRLHHRWVVFTERQKKPARARRAPRVPSTSQRGRLMAAEAHRTELRPRWATSFRLFRIDLNEGRVMATKKTAKSAAKPAEHRAAKTAVSRSKLAAVGRTKALPRKIASAKASPNTLTKVRKQAARKGQSPTADMWPRLSSRAWRSGARMASRVPLRLAGSGLMSWRACRLRDGAVMLICAGWLPQGRAVRQERFCWSRYRA